MKSVLTPVLQAGYNGELEFQAFLAVGYAKRDGHIRERILFFRKGSFARRPHSGGTLDFCVSRPGDAEVDPATLIRTPAEEEWDRKLGPACARQPTSRK